MQVRHIIAFAATATASIVGTGSEVMLAIQRPDLASVLPFSAPDVARAYLPFPVGGGAHNLGRGLALSALETSPLVEPAVATLALDRNGQAKAGSDLINLAEHLSRRDVAVQRASYNKSLSEGDFPVALRHLDTLMRIAPSQDVQARLVAGTRLPAFLTELCQTLRTIPPWSILWLRQNAKSLSDDALKSLTGAILAGLKGDRSNFVRELTEQLLAAGRPDSAVRLWRTINPTEGEIPFELTWKARLHGETPSPFEWQVPNGFQVDALNPTKMQAIGQFGQAIAYRLIALRAGTYALITTDQISSHSGWLYGLGCAGTKPAPSKHLLERNIFTITPDCPVQWIAVETMAFAPNPISLGPLRIVPAP